MEREIDSFYMVKQTNHEDLNRGDCALHEVEKSIVEAEWRPPCAGYTCAGIDVSKGEVLQIVKDNNIECICVPANCT